MVRQFIHALGGPKAVAEKLRAQGHEVSEDNVSIWGTRDNIPHKHRFQMALLAQREGMTAQEAPEVLRGFFGSSLVIETAA